MRNFLAPFLAAATLLLASATPNFSQSQSLSSSSSITEANANVNGYVRCQAHERHVEMMGLNAKYSANHENIQQQTAGFVAARQANRSSVLDVVTIPIVFHVLYNNASENITDARLMEQLQILNDDFRRTNADANGTWAQAADAEVEFCLAVRDPQGEPTTGINRVSTSVSSWGTNDAMKFTAQGGADAWPTGNYLNFWVCNMGGGILGYAQFPGGPASTDGVVCGYTTVGLSGSAAAPYNLGRTATHEVGHWLNLYHIWGDGGCGVDDAVADTPESDAANYSCASSHTSCATVDMIENYMDYTDDACMNLFTQGQADRMAAVLAPSGFRGSLRLSNGCQSTFPDFDLDVAIQEVLTPLGTLCDSTIYPSVEIKNEGGTTLTAVQLNVSIDGTSQSTYEWTGSLSFGQSTTVALPTSVVSIGLHDIVISAALPNGLADENAANNSGTEGFEIMAGGGSSIKVRILTDNYGYETDWTLVNSSNTSILTGSNYGNNDLITADAFCVADDCYTFTINDSYGDGICCEFGDGIYIIWVDGVLVASGGQFGSTESVEFCTNNAADVPGCTDPAACNFSVDATVDDGSCVFPGCMDPTAVNYNPEAGCDDGNCEPGTGGCNGDDYCGQGTSWDAATEQCVVTFPGDTDFDGCMSVSDILIMLGSFGSCL
jgi:hypothetical protein